MASENQNWISGDFFRNKPPIHFNPACFLPTCFPLAGHPAFPPSKAIGSRNQGHRFKVQGCSRIEGHWFKVQCSRLRRSHESGPTSRSDQANPDPPRARTNLDPPRAPTKRIRTHLALARIVEESVFVELRISINPDALPRNTATMLRSESCSGDAIRSE